MTILLFANKAQTTIAVPVVPGDLTVTVATGDGALFPSPGAGQAFTFTMSASDGSYYEDTLCTSRTGDVLTITRAQEGTTAQSFAFNDPCGNLLTKGTMEAMAQSVTLGTASTLNASDQLGTVSAVQVYAGNPNGNIAGNAATVGTIAPSMVWDTTDSIFWVCIGTGTTSTAIWLAINTPGSTTYCGTSTGSANAQVVTPAIPVTLSAGLSLAFIAGYTNSGTLTLNASSTGIKNVYKEGPAGPIPCTGGEVVAGNLVSVRYDGTQYQLTATELGTAALANASSATGTLAAVSGAVTVGHLATFSDTAGTIVDGGLPSAAAAPTYLNHTNNGQTLGSGAYTADTTTASGGAFSINLPSSPANGTSLSFEDTLFIWGTNNFTVNGNGHTITALSQSDTTLVCNTAGLAFSVQWSTAATTWEMF